MATATTPRANSLTSASRAVELILPIGIVASVLVILVPLPTGLMNLLLSVNITAAVLILLTTVYVRTPLEFSIFPSLLLATTLARLVLNVATTRMILTRAPTAGLDAAGGVVRAFGQFVAGDQMVVGLIIFVIIVVIQFVVITKGATRISEVAARFALDGMPGRQMAIDADLSAGLIDQREAQRRREEVTAQADFFGAMDGASKFVRGDAVAGIFITIINIAGGLFIGIFQAGMSPAEAAGKFTMLTIGDGLVSQVPALLISLAAGLLVTRSTRDTNLPSEFVRQLFSRPEALATAGVFLGVLVFTDLPRIPLLVLGSSCVGLAVLLTRRNQQARKEAEAERRRDAAPAEPRVEDHLAGDPIEFELGLGLLRLADPRQGGDLLDRVGRVRQTIAAELGIILPKVRLRDNMSLGRNEYRLKLGGAAVAAGQVLPDRWLAVESPAVSGRVRGVPTVDPARGEPALWIERESREDAKRHGYTLVEPAGVLASHLATMVRQYADELLTRDAAKHLIDELRRTSPAVVDELIPGVMKLAEVQQILQMLLREHVPIRPLNHVLDALGHAALRTNDPILLVEHVRSRMARTLSAAYRDKEHRLRVVTLDPALEDQIRASIEQTDQGLFVRMPPRATEEICRTIAVEIESLTADRHPPVVLVDPQIRPALRRLTAASLPNLIVLSHNEITRDTQIEAVAMVEAEGMQI